MKRIQALIKTFQKNSLLSRGVFLFVLFTSVAILTLTPRVAHAGCGVTNLGECFANLVLNLSMFLVEAATFLINFLLTALVWLARQILNASINLALTANYTSGSLFTAGWPVVRDLANMGLILVLVAIGIGTMLQLSVNKRQLIKFFIIAVLINFTPIITGIIIDLSNIVSSIFFESAVNTGNALMNMNPFKDITAKIEQLVQRLSVFQSISLSEVIAIIIQSVSSIIFNLVLLFIFSLLSVIFLVRILFVIVLVIFSPLGFLASIVPTTQRWWKKWWNNFLQWCILPIPLLFFLWLAGLFLNNPLCGNIEFIAAGGSVAEIFKESQGVICKSMTLALGTGAIIMGILISFSSASESTRMIMSRAQGYWRGGQRRLGNYTRRAALAPGKAAGRAVQRPLGKTAGRVGTFVGRVPIIGAPIARLGTRAEAAGASRWQQNKKKYAHLQNLDGDRQVDIVRSRAHGNPEEFLAAFESMNDAGKRSLASLEITDPRRHKAIMEKYVQAAEPRGGTSLQDWLGPNSHFVRYRRRNNTDADVQRFAAEMEPKYLGRVSASAYRDEDVVRGLWQNPNYAAQHIHSAANNDGRRTALQGNLPIFDKEVMFAGGRARPATWDTMTPDERADARIDWLRKQGDRRLKAIGERAASNPNVRQIFSDTGGPTPPPPPLPPDGTPRPPRHRPPSGGAAAAAAGAGLVIGAAMGGGGSAPRPPRHRPPTPPVPTKTPGFSKEGLSEEDAEKVRAYEEEREEARKREEETARAEEMRLEKILGRSEGRDEGPVPPVPPPPSPPGGTPRPPRHRPPTPPTTGGVTPPSPSPTRPVSPPSSPPSPGPTPPSAPLTPPTAPDEDSGSTVPSGGAAGAGPTSKSSAAPSSTRGISTSEGAPLREMLEAQSKNITEATQKTITEKLQEQSKEIKKAITDAEKLMSESKKDFEKPPFQTDYEKTLGIQTQQEVKKLREIINNPSASPEAKELAKMRLSRLTGQPYRPSS